MNATLRSDIVKSIKAATGVEFKIKQIENCGGGCINDAVILYGADHNYFVKLNSVEKLEMFVAEATGLESMKCTGTIYVPGPLAHGSCSDKAYLVLEALDLVGSGDWTAMGRKLAKMHRHTADRFGWGRDNTIGSTPQHNQWTDNWTDFFCEHRLGFQFKLAHQNGHNFQQVDALIQSATKMLAEHKTEPSLLHGDLWSGNASFLLDGQPVIYDPACYYGDRETDLAFSEFFGGFPSEFYQGYYGEWPLTEGYERRKILYNLYHILNHANLFGGSYADQAQRMIWQLI